MVRSSNAKLVQLKKSIQIIQILANLSCTYPLIRWVVLYSNPRNTAIVPAGEFGLKIVSISFFLLLKDCDKHESDSTNAI